MGTSFVKRFETANRLRPMTPPGDREIVMFMPYVNPKAADLVAETLTQRHPDGRLWIGEGPRVKEFEAMVQERFGLPYCLALNSGTAGLRLALALAGVGPGDEVITTAQTCTATNTPILEQFARPVFADIQFWTGNIDPGDIEHRITEKTKAIMVVHWAGYPCDMDEIRRIAYDHDLPVIQDGAHALGATYKGVPVGALTEYCMFSLQAIKQLTTGDGGLLSMTRQGDYEEGKRRRWFGIDRDRRERREDGYSFWNQAEPGYKMQMNDISASIGIANMEHIDRLLEQRRQISERYFAELSDVEGVTLFKRLPDRQSAHWLFTMHVERRGDFCRMMTARKIEVSVVHIRNDQHDVFGPQRDDLPATDAYAKSNISIPLHNDLTDDQVGYVIEAIKRGW